MGLRCIIGHDYGGAERTETREERGEEEVVTVREYRECARCGYQQVISENTEVRSTEEPETEGTEETEAPESEAPESEEPIPGRSDTEYEEVSAEEDDGVILDGDDDEPERASGEWPETESQAEPRADHEDWPDDHRERTAGVEDADHGDWPTPDGDDEGFAAEPSSGGPDESVDFGGGLNPDRSGGPIEEGRESIEEAGGMGGGSEPSGPHGNSDPVTGIRRSDPGPTPTTQQRPANPDTEFVCPNCDHTASAHESSLRPGDICPACGRGYLTERDDV